MDVNKIDREIEVRFLGIDKNEVAKKLLKIGAQDLGEELLEETIFYDPEKKWLKEKKMVRLRKSPTKMLMTFKHTLKDSASGTREIELGIDDIQKAQKFLENLGLKAFRRQEKRRHTFLWDSVSIDIDEHPKVPAYLEIEGPNETILQDAARALGLNWNSAHFESSRDFIEQIYKIPLTSLSVYTFKKIK